MASPRRVRQADVECRSGACIAARIPVELYDLTPEPRTAAEVLARDGDKPAPPRAKAKWLTASVAEDAAEVVGSVFDEAERRDPGHLCLGPSRPDLDRLFVWLPD